MAQQNLTRLNVVLNAVTGAFEKRMKSARGKISDLGESIKKKLLGPMGQLTAAFSGGAILAGIKLTADGIDRIAKQAQTLQTSTQALVGLSHAAEMNGSSAEKMSATISEMTKKLGEAVQGTGDAKVWLDKFGLSAEALAAKRPEEVIGIYADKIKELPNAAMQAEAANRLLGDSNAELIPLLKGGSEGIAELAKEAEQLNLTMSNVDASKVEAANDAISKAGKVIKGIFTQLTIKLAPFFEAFADSFTEAGKNVDGLGKIFDKMIGYAVKGAGFIADAWDGLRIVWEGFKVGVNSIGQSFAWVWDKTARFFQWIGTKAVQTWRLIETRFMVVVDGIRYAWASLKVPVAEFVQFVSSQLVTLIHTAADALSFLDTDLEIAARSTADKIAAATGGMAATAEMNAKKVGDELRNTIQDSKDATTQFLSDVNTTGSATAQRIGKNFSDARKEAIDNITAIRSEERKSAQIERYAETIQTKAQIAAEARAKELEAVKLHNHALTEAEMSYLTKLREQRAKDEATRALLSGKYNKEILSGSSSFFGNLSKLQEHHSKNARKIGKIAAKAKIATDTASAAMAAYKAMAGIPIVGPGLAAAAAGAAILAGGIQMRNAESESIGPGPSDSSTGNIGGIATPATQPTQDLILNAAPGDKISVDDLIDVYREAEERGIRIGGISRG